MSTVARRSLAGAAVLVATLGVTVPAFAAGSGAHHSGRSQETLLSARLVGSLTTDPALFGVNPGGADWSVSRSTVKVKADGRVDVKVRDLVLTSTGANPVPTISASLVCNGMVVDTVGPVAYDTEGDARIRDRFSVPDRCLAPAVLLNPLERVGTYIAASGSAR
jgi:hypothetical protein